MEQVINRVEEALGIIEKVKEVANGIRINNHQCRRLANHFETVGSSLCCWRKVKEVGNGIRINNHQCRRLANHFETVGSSLCCWKEVCRSTLTNDEEIFSFPTAAFNDLLVVLKRGEALVLQYNEQHWLTRLLTRAENHESFEDIHKELDKCKLFLLSGEFDHSTDNNVNFGRKSVEQENDVLFSVAHQDQAEMLGTLESLCSSPPLESLCSSPPLESLCSSPPLDHTREDLQNVRNEEALGIIEKALGIIEKVKEVANGTWINNHQCRRLANHFETVGHSLCYWREVCRSTLMNDEEIFPFPIEAFNDLLVVLKRGEALVLQYNEHHWLTRLLTRADNHEGFEDIHRELDKCKLFLLSGEFDHSTDNNVNFGTMSVDQENDAHQDQAEMLGTLESLYSSPPLDHTREDLQNVRNVLYETFQGHEDNECEDLDRLPSHFKVNHSDYSVERVIGQGGFGVVTKSKWLGCDVAVKRIGKDFHSLTPMYKEVGFLNRLRHPQIVQVVGVSLPTDSSRGLWSGDIIMELMDGDLRTLIEKRMQKKKWQGVPFNQREAIDIIIQIARGIQHLHMKGCMHRDIKPSNILFNDHGNYVDVKITDFGISNQVAREDVYTSKDTYTRLGTVMFIAPEVLGPGYSAKADIYSFGITCFQILTGMSPNELSSNFEFGQRAMLPLDFGGKLRDLIQDCWNLDPTHRPTATEICARLDEIRCLDAHDGGFMHFAIAKKFLNLTRPTVYHMKRFFHLFGRHGFEDIETSEGEEVPRLDGAESSRSTPNIQGLPRYLRIDPSTFQALWRIHGDEEDRVQVIGTQVGGCKYVIKTFKNIEGQEQDPSFRIELDFFIKLHHPHIVRLMGYSLDCFRTSIVLEWMPSDLRKLINDRTKTKNSTRPFSKREAKSLITQIAAGMAFLHGRHVFHRDLKARNVLVHEHPDSLHAKITDFGASQDFYVASPVESVGTGYWRAPEIFRAMRDNRQFEYTAKADVYSFAMVCYEILSGKEPFEDHKPSQFDFLIVSSAVPKRPSLPGNQNHPLNKLIRTCWDDVPERRPTFRDILSKLEDMV